MDQFKSFIRGLLKWPPFPSFVLVVLFIIVNSITLSGFLTISYLTGFLTSNIALICVAVGSAIILLVGGIDISLGAILSLVNVVYITFIGKQCGMGSALVAAIGTGILIGMLNGTVVGFLRVTPLLATFATSSIAAGIALWIMPHPGGMAPQSFVNWFNGFTLGIPSTIYFIVLLLILWYFTKSTPLGIWIYAVGKDERKAFLSAVPVSWIKFFVYTFGGFMAAIGGIAISGSIGSGDALVGLALSIKAIAACVIGGISMLGGKGEIAGSIVGVLFLGLVIAAVQAQNISPFYQDLVSGLILLVGILGTTMLQRVLYKN